MKALAAVLTAVVALGAGSARAGSDATFVLDRTYSCSIALHGGIYQLENRAHPGARSGGSWSKLAYAGLRAGVFSGGTGNLLAWISAGKPTKTTTVDQEFWTFDVRTFGTVGVSGKNCNPTRSPVALTAKGLRGGAAAALGSELKCDVPRRVLVRVRAVLASRGSLHGREFEAVHVPVQEAKLAVRTIGGRPLTYATVSQSGKSTLFTARGCVPE
ncbi:MAG TPA: hypothetical protein VJ807_05150 [Gaiellaceae bacterium]|nr:hypothetical protein [Gaiellaceae bacterium]